MWTWDGSPSESAHEVEPLAPLRRRLLEAAAVVVLALALNLAGNGCVSLWDRDEPRYSACVREMRARGDWVHPTFNGQPRYQKPILIYWLMRAGMALGGDNPFGARLVSSVAGAGTCLLVWWLGRRMFGARTGLLAASMLATAPIMVAESKLATTDATLTLLLVGCQACLWELGRHASRSAAALFWTLLALATLTKGPVGLALIAVAGAVSWWWGGPTDCWRRLHWRAGLAWFTLLTAPWFIAVGLLSRGEFFRVALGQQLVERVTTPLEEHGGFPGYYAVATLGMFFPWSAFLPPALLTAWSRRRVDPQFGFLLGWVVGPFLLLECVRTKIVHYYVPSYPACALLAAWLVGVVTRAEINLRRWPLGRMATGLLGGIGIGGTVALTAMAVVSPAGVRWPSLALAILMGVGTLAALRRLLNGQTERGAATLVAAWAAIMLAFGAWFLPAAEPYKLPRVVGERLAKLSAAWSAQPLLLSFQEPSIVYALGRPAPEIRTWTAFFEELDRYQTVLVAAFPHELKALRANPYLAVDEVDTLDGFNLSKGRAHSLRFAVIRRESLAVQTARIQKLFIK